MEPGPISTALARNLRIARAAAGLHQRQVAEAVGVSHQLLSEWEHGRRRPPVDRWPAICRALDITLFDLLAGVDREDAEALGLTRKRR